MSLFIDRNELGFYTWEGIEYPSVTTILGGALTGESLLTWYAKMAAKDCADILKRRLEMVAALNMQKQAGNLSAQDWASASMKEVTDCDAKILDWESRMRAAIVYRDFKANVGSIVHHAFYDRVSGESDLLSVPLDYLQGIVYKLHLLDDRKPALSLEDADRESRHLAEFAAPYVARLFLWVDRESPAFDAIGLEAVVVSERERYAGRKDMRFRANGILASVAGTKEKVFLTGRYIGDIKTSNNVDYSKWPVQMEAYKRADFIGTLHDGKAYTIGDIDGTVTLWVKAESPVEVIYWPAEQSGLYWQLFLAARDVFEAKRAMAKGAHEFRELSLKGAKECARS